MMTKAFRIGCAACCEVMNQMIPWLIRLCTKYIVPMYRYEESQK